MVPKDLGSDMPKLAEVIRLGAGPRQRGRSVPKVDSNRGSAGPDTAGSTCAGLLSAPDSLALRWFLDGHPRRTTRDRQLSSAAPPPALQVETIDVLLAAGRAASNARRCAAGQLLAGRTNTWTRH